MKLEIGKLIYGRPNLSKLCPVVWSCDLFLIDIQLNDSMSVSDISDLEQQKVFFNINYIIIALFYI